MFSLFEFNLFLFIEFYLALECSVVANPASGVANIVTDGLGPCKFATQAEQGIIDIEFSAVNQAVFIAITADSKRNTRIRLTCTDLTASPGVPVVAAPAAVFTVNHRFYFKITINKMFLFFLLYSKVVK